MKEEIIQGGKESVAEKMQKIHEEAKGLLGSAYDEGKLDAVAAVRGEYETILKELAAIPNQADRAAWYARPENAESIEMFGK